MRSEWKEVRLGDVCDFQKGFAFKSKDYQTNGVRIVRVSDFNDYSINLDSCMYIDYDKAKNYGQYELNKDDVIITTVGSWPTNPKSVVGKVIRVQEDAAKSLLNQNAVRIRAIMDQRFMFYLLKNNCFSQYIVGTAQGSANQASITQNDIKNFTFLLPNESEQRAIAATLSCLDDKIELNNKINANLEAQAQAIFKSWFVDFEPFRDGEFVESELGLIPKGWRVVELSDYCSMIVRGITPRYSENSDQLIINQKCIRNHEVSLQVARRHEPKAITEKWLNQGDILVNSTGQGTLGRTAQWFGLQKNVTVDSHVTIVRPKEDKYVFYLGQLIMSREAEIEDMASGSTGQTELSRNRLGSLRAIFPESEVLKDFSTTIEPLVKMRIQNNYLTDYLSQLRDTLLPKLMSGEIEVPNNA